MSHKDREKSPKNQQLKGKKYAKFEKQRAKIIHTMKQKSMGRRDLLPWKNLGVHRSNLLRSAKNFDKTGVLLGQNGCPIGVARKMVSRFVLRTSRESV
jgi:hypothetical protein